MSSVDKNQTVAQPAPAGATPECRTCSDHGAVGNILTAEPCPDCTRWNVQPAPATQQAGERVYAFRRKGLDDFCTCEEARYEELSNKPHLFETRIFYTAPQPVAREPLTPERVKEIVRGAGYDQCGIPDTERAAFINGLRHGEQAHGIKGGQHGNDT